MSLGPPSSTANASKQTVTTSRRLNLRREIPETTTLAWLLLFLALDSGSKNWNGEGDSNVFLANKHPRSSTMHLRTQRISFFFLFFVFLVPLVIPNVC